MKDLLQTQSLADLKTVKNLANLSYEQRLQIQETLRQSEAREWIKRYRENVIKIGKIEASAWWQRILSDLVKRRGQKAVDDLQRRMNEIRS